MFISSQIYTNHFYQKEIKYWFKQVNKRNQYSKIHKIFSSRSKYGTKFRNLCEFHYVNLLCGKFEISENNHKSIIAREKKRYGISVFLLESAQIYSRVLPNIKK